LVEDQAHDSADLLVGVQGYLAGRQFEVASGHGDKQFAALGLVQLAAFQPIAHGGQLNLAHVPLSHAT